MHSADTRTFAYGARLTQTQTLFDGLQVEGRTPPVIRSQVCEGWASSASTR